MAATNTYQKNDAPRKPLHEMEDKDLVELNDEWFDRVIENRRATERDTLLNIAFLMDHQYVSVSKVQNTVQLIPQPKKKGRVRTVEQIIEPAFRSEMSRLLRIRPRGIVVPLGDDPEDMEAASAADDSLSYILQSHLVEEYQEQAVLWMLSGGTAHLNVSWDPMKIDENGKQGDFLFRALSPFECGVPHNRKWRLEDQPYFMVTKAYEIDEIQDRWGQKVEPDRNDKFSSIDDRLTSILNLSSSATINSANKAIQEIPMAVVKETWIKPSGLAPKGAVLITCSGKILDLQTWPEWCNNQYPFYKQEYMTVPGRYWGKPMLNALIPLQRRHNRAASVIVETMNILAQTRLGVPRNTKVRGVLGGKGVLFETPLGSTSPVTNISAPPVGDLPFRELDNTRIAARDISHQHEVTKGTTPPNVRSGTAINALKELDDSAAIIPIRGIERASQSLGRHILSIVQTQWDEERFVYVLGETGDIEKRAFLKGSEISGQYIVQPGSGFPYSRAERQAMVYDAFDRGLLNPEEALEFAEFGTPRKILRERNLTKRHARRENQKFETLTAINPQTGQPDPQFIKAQFQQLLPADWHDHETHLMEHNKVRISPTYERWPNWRKALFESHINGHMVALQVQMGGDEPRREPPPPPEEQVMENG